MRRSGSLGLASRDHDWDRRKRIPCGTGFMDRLGLVSEAGMLR